jgi:hypothetical protein
MKIINKPYGSRLSWNSNGWKKPSVGQGKCFGTGNEASNFECFAGFGFEEWLFNEDFQAKVKGVNYQYGFIQCFHKNKSRANSLFQVFHIWTRFCKGCCEKSNQGEFYNVGTIKNLEVLNFNDFSSDENLENPIKKFGLSSSKLEKQFPKGILPSHGDPRFFNVRFPVEDNRDLFRITMEQILARPLKNEFLPGFRFRTYNCEGHQGL